MTHIPVVVGIDGGGSKTRALILDRNANTIGYGESSGSNPQDKGFAVSAMVIAEAIRAAKENSSSKDIEISHLFCGQAGVGCKREARILSEALHCYPEFHDARIDIDHDLRIALEGGLSGKPGIALILGTGSACFGKNADGQTARSGGWGPILDDAGSGYAIGLKGLNAYVKSKDGRLPPSILTQNIGEAIPEETDDRSLIAALSSGTMNRARIASLATSVVNSAIQGDHVAFNILETQSEEAAQLASAVATNLKMDHIVKVVLAGGLATEGSLYRDLVAEKIEALVPNSLVSAPISSPVAGAVIIAARNAGFDLSEAQIESMETNNSEKAV